MSSMIYNATPMPRLTGIKDESRGQNVRDDEQLPTHLPHFYIYAEQGPTEPTYVDGESLTTIFGQKTMDQRHKYYNHQSAFVNTALGRGNGVFVQRVIPNDAGPKSRILLSADIIAQDIQQYQRDPNGKFKLDASGQKIPVSGAGATVPGHKIKWVVNSWTAGGTSEDFANVSSRVGSLTDGADQSTLYPILELEANFVGEYGNNIALRLVAPSTDSEYPLNIDAVQSLKSMIYRLSLLRRDSVESSSNVVRTMDSDDWLDVCLSEDSIDLRNGFDYNFDERIVNAYQDLSAPGQSTPIYGPLGRAHLYRDNLELILEMIGEAEDEFGTLLVPDIVAEPEYLYTINPFTATSTDGIPYYSVELESVANGNQRFGDSSQVFGAGGSDGTMSNAAFDLLVRNELSNYGYTEYPLLDWAKYPMSAYYDSGFELDTKFAFFNVMARRKDVGIVLSTHVYGKPQLLPSEESSMAMTLNNMARNYPESVLHGTSVVRCLIFGHSGKLINGALRGYVPLTIEALSKFSAYMGAGNGLWVSTAAFDDENNNRLDMFDPRTVNQRWKPETARYRDWDNGLNWVESYDRKSLFFPAIQTVYNDDTSILNAAANMWIAIDLEKVAQNSWRHMTGNSKLSDAQFLERSDERITESVRGKYDNRALITPRTYYTASDRRRGYSYSCDITFAGNNMKGPGTFTIIAKRLSDVTTAA